MMTDGVFYFSTQSGFFQKSEKISIVLLGSS